MADKLYLPSVILEAFRSAFGVLERVLGRG